MWGSAPPVSAPSARNIRAPKRGRPCRRKGVGVGSDLTLRIRSRVLRRLPGRALGFLARRFLLFGVQFLGHRQRRPNPPLAILGRPPTRRGLLAAGGAGIGIKLRAQIVHRLFCLAPALLQGRMPPERRRPRRGAHPRHPPPTRSGAACSGKKSNSPSSSPDAVNRPLTRIRHVDSRHRNRNAQYLVGPSSKDFQALRVGKRPKAPIGEAGDIGS
jgi:hypothetical protein